MRASRARAGRWLVGLLVLLALAAGSYGGRGVAAADEEFAPPLGARDGHQYAPRVEHDQNGTLYEDTSYGAQNPDLQGATCFGLAWELLYHAGQDLYRTDGQSTAGAEVTAVADGTVVYADPNLNYPGLVVIIEHILASGDRIYSLYAHLDDNSLVVRPGDKVQQAQRLGTVMYQRYSGRFPKRHPSGDDSHLHFEMRRFADASAIYDKHPSCNGLVVGRGYTYPEHPSDFPQPNAGYTDPAGLIKQ